MPVDQKETLNKTRMNIFDEILKNRGIVGLYRKIFLNPDYNFLNDPYLLPDMQKAVDRIIHARKKNQKITIYGDYDIDGLTASSLLLDAFNQFGFEHVEVFIPNRFVEGYGLTIDAIESIASRGTDLIITVDCGSLSHEPINRCNELGVDIIVTDHHNVADIQPNAIAVINPKRVDHKYPFKELAGVGVAFKLVQALQIRLKGLEIGQEKWLLDLVALGSICDIVPLVGENRIFAYYGLKVLSKTRRPGLKELMKISGINPELINSRDIGFALGPRMNASGRLETARHSLDLLTTKNSKNAKKYALKLHQLNQDRRKEQEDIYKEALVLAEKDNNDVLVLCSPKWNHGIVGIVASKIVEKCKKPTFVLQDLGNQIKGSARSFGDFNVAEAIKFASDVITKGGGHNMAAGVTLPPGNVNKFRDKVNQYYKSLKLKNQDLYFIPKHDIELDSLSQLTTETVNDISKLEPFGNSNEKPIIKFKNMRISKIKYLGIEKNHLKLELIDKDNQKKEFLKFGASLEYKLKVGQKINLWATVQINEWGSKQQVEGMFIDIELN